MINAAVNQTDRRAESVQFNCFYNKGCVHSKTTKNKQKQPTDKGAVREDSPRMAWAEAFKVGVWPKRWQKHSSLGLRVELQNVRSDGHKPPWEPCSRASTKAILGRHRLAALHTLRP